MIEHAAQTETTDSQHSYKAFFFELGQNVDEGSQHFPVVVKNVTTTGIILELIKQPESLDHESLKGRAGLFTVLGHDDCIVIRSPGKILWLRNHDSDGGVTLGLELLEPLPLPIRRTIEESMSIGAKDMKVLWDYWDEIQASDSPVETPASVAAVRGRPDNVVPMETLPESGGNGGWIYYMGFGAILCGLAMQFPQSESLGISGLAVMFLGSLIIAWKSVVSMWRVSSSGPTD